MLSLKTEGGHLHNLDGVPTLITRAEGTSKLKFIFDYLFSPYTKAKCQEQTQEEGLKTQIGLHVYPSLPLSPPVWSENEVYSVHPVDLQLFAFPCGRVFLIALLQLSALSTESSLLNFLL